ncbi:MAG: peptidoglycan-binding protein [Alphaproteobacteria bacterium]|nr:peptidoglycan-binding protein [Alphaproteobacteria bacterium]
MKKFTLLTAITVSTLALGVGAYADDTSRQTGSQFNGDAAYSGADNSVARGTVTENEATDTVTVKSSTGTVPGTARVTVDEQTGDVDAHTGANAMVSEPQAERNEAAEERADVSDNMTTELGTLMTRAEGSIGTLNANEIRQIQGELRAKGYRVQVDGIYGPRTAEALKAYQKEHDMPVSSLTKDADADGKVAALDQSDDEPRE